MVEFSGFTIGHVQLKLPIRVGDIDNKVVGHHSAGFAGINVGQQTT
jgi:hypothetical protein